MITEFKLSCVRLKAFVSITSNTPLTLEQWQAARAHIRHELDKAGIGARYGLRVDLNCSVTQDSER